jgi:hypothetical protein
MLTGNDHPKPADVFTLNKSEQFVREPFRNKRLLDPIERISEILFGLIMALSFTCAISVVETDRVGVKEMLIGAIGCNIAWGIIDAFMYLINVLIQRGRDISIMNFVRNTREPEKARKYIAETFSPELTAVIKKESLELIREDIISANRGLMRTRIFINDFKTAFGIFILVFLSTFPVAIPFALIKNVHLALRISNGIAILLLFLGGWFLARYGALKKFRTGFIMALIGIGMVLLTISLGG